ncbi:hypothetical protein [Nocardia sp. NRRL S-836]|uniref:hypothetical protein n=1 Tax=Nocardia sp. NRRL S-836 TaxID=1519492 RepID=UPI0006AF77A4|nr:hypothetical protein [Nocardia sp. NRRL S-836]KOV81764.1 hypothetical protein ADL03_27575 [Nocardia sp. NRRL S-836]
MSAPAGPAPADTSDTALYQLKRFSEAADKIRSNATTAAKTLGGLGTAGIAAVGVAKFSDVFPLPGGGDSRAVLLGIAVIVGFALMLGAVLLLTGRIWYVSEPVFTTSDIGTMVRLGSVTEGERPLVDAVYKETVDLNFTPTEPVRSLKAYEAKAIDLEREAAGKPVAERPELLAQATAIRNDIRATQARAATLVIRKRAAAIGTVARLSAPVILFATGLAMANLSADGLDAWRATDKKVATVKACADAVEALTKNKISMDELPPGCGKPAPSAAQTADILTGLMTRYTTQCVNATAGTQDCVAVLDAIGKAAANATP